MLFLGHFFPKNRQNNVPEWFRFLRPKSKILGQLKPDQNLPDILPFCPASPVRGGAVGGKTCLANPPTTCSFWLWASHEISPETGLSSTGFLTISPKLIKIAKFAKMPIFVFGSQKIKLNSLIFGRENDKNRQKVKSRLYSRRLEKRPFSRKSTCPDSVRFFQKSEKSPKIDRFWPI